ncbi:LytTR family DNA-binding domain-containing protein [Terrabacter aerolatus]|uniref:DNA-binding response regulator n=1 Tax=Terrabacter aerolatus TaxID=422442 RepID=A0A512CY45_9MICO|nr:LytTR family DNA-binding domain-containing protein [Terrabacter aerolatus]GEO29138.1 DNA-binding response regulator [Terrabacter aerolatus]
MTGPADPTEAHADPSSATGGAPLLRVLAVDDEAPALDELAWMLGRHECVRQVVPAQSGEAALRVLHDGQVDAVFMDVQMPGLSGLDLARVLSRFTTQPPIVFVTAHEQHAVDAFELNVVDYVLKPVRDERLDQAVRRVVRQLGGREPAAASADENIVVELAGVSRLVPRSEVLFVEAQGDYARLHTATESHLVRVPLTTLADQWREAGFVRIHRSSLVALGHIGEWRTEGGRTTVVVGGHELVVSRRHTRALRDLLVRRAQPLGRGGP